MKTKTKKKKKNRPFEYSKLYDKNDIKRGIIYIYICGIYPSILNWEYRSDKIISDWTKYGYPIEMKEDIKEIK